MVISYMDVFDLDRRITVFPIRIGSNDMFNLCVCVCVCVYEFNIVYIVYIYLILQQKYFFCCFLGLFFGFVFLDFLSFAYLNNASNYCRVDSLLGVGVFIGRVFIGRIILGQALAAA